MARKNTKLINFGDWFFMVYKSGSDEVIFIIITDIS